MSGVTPRSTTPHLAAPTPNSNWMKSNSPKTDFLLWRKLARSSKCTFIFQMIRLSKTTRRRNPHQPISIKWVCHMDLQHYAFGYFKQGDNGNFDLPFSASESRLLKEFSKYGQIAEVRLVKDEVRQKSKGFAFIQYTSQEAALLALESMDYQLFDERQVFVELAKPRKSDFGGYPRTSGPLKNKAWQF
ncbi:hypothetical protein SASPL_155725 [Salvia splendens]|uniref:RRM domain-containing protein n=1 Tax=Salvia splendens TaxID=180675 RepID=A0A8X8VY35_SALSN|nr:hypothetical protein SASPL_155725 [Salvia splendens]